MSAVHLLTICLSNIYHSLCSKPWAINVCVCVGVCRFVNKILNLNRIIF